MDQNTIDRLTTLENEIEQKLEERRTLLRESTGEVVENYTLLDTDGREVRLADLFGEKDELIVVHNMGRGCTYCTLWADGFNGVADHLASRAAFALISPDTPEVQKAFAEGRNWKFPTYSAAESSFTEDMDYVSRDEEGQVFYMPGYSVFTKDEEGTIRRTGRDFFGPNDMYSGIWHMFAMLPEGVRGWYPRFSYEREKTETA